MFGEKLHLEEDENEPVQFAKKGKSNSGEKGHIDMTPMVDVVFQLLTFFLLAVKRDSQEPIDVPTVTRSDAVADSESTYITIKPPLGGSKEPVIILGDRGGGGADKKEIKPEDVKSEVESGVKNGRPKIIVKAERLVAHGDVLKICRIVASVEGAVLHVGVQTRE